MEDNKTENTAVVSTSTPVKKTVTKKTTAKKATTPKVKAATKTTVTSKSATAKPTAKRAVTKKTTAAKPELPNAVEAPKPSVVKEVAEPKVEPSTFQKVIKTGKKTGAIVTDAGKIIIGSSILTTKAIAGLTTKAGKKAFEIGKDLLSDTTKAVKQNQETVVDTSKKALKETVETIKDSHLIENPLKKKK